MKILKSLVFVSTLSLNCADLLAYEELKAEKQETHNVGSSRDQSTDPKMYPIYAIGGAFGAAILGGTFYNTAKYCYQNNHAIQKSIVRFTAAVSMQVSSLFNCAYPYEDIESGSSSGDGSK